MKQKKKTVKTGISRVLRWSKKHNAWREPKENKYEAELVIIVDGKEKRIFRPFPTVKAAELARAQAATGVYKYEVSTGMLFRDLQEIWKQNALPHLGLATGFKVHSQFKHLEYFNNIPVEKITSVVVDSWIAYVKSPEYLLGVKSTLTSYHQSLKVLRQVLGYYSSRVNTSYKLPFQPEHRDMIKVRAAKPKAKKDLSLDEFRRFLIALRKSCDERHEPIYHLALAQYALYARVQEVAALEFQDVDLTSGTIVINKRVIYPRFRGQLPVVDYGLKASKEKVIRSPATARRFIKWAMRKGIRSGRLFEVDGRIISYRMIQDKYDRALKSCGLAVRGTHLLRHAALTEHYATCKDILQTKEVAGHSDLKMTQVYAKSRESDLRGTQAIMDEKLGTVQQDSVVGYCGN